MRKRGLFKLMQGELIFWILLVVLSTFFLYLTTIKASKNLLIATGVLNILVLETWFMRAFFLFSGRKISQYSEVIQRISFKDRFFDYFILPAVFLATFMFYLYFNKNLTVGYLMIGLCMTTVLLLFINIKSSLRKFYKIGTLTKGVFNLIEILTFFLSINVFLRFDINVWIKLLVVGGLALLIFLSELQIQNRITLVSSLISLLSSIFVALSIGMFVYQSIFTATAIGTLAFYLVISIWNIRFSGKYKFADYLPPLLYSVIALILIFNL